MAKINIVISDTDVLYLNRLSNYLKEKADTFNVSSFSSQEILEKYLSNTTDKIDILIIPEVFISEKIKQFNIPAKIMFSDGSCDKVNGFDPVNKYQKAEKLISDILLIFAERTGKTYAVAKGNKNTKIIGIYSPVGGCGKTTIALALSTICASSGLKVFYLNFEKLNSSEAFFAKAPNGSMSDLFLALKTKGSNVGLKIISNKYTDPVTKVNYINPVESAVEFDEITDEEVTRLIKEFDSLGEYDVVFIDMPSAFDKYNINILNQCDKILMPFDQNPLSIVKISKFLNEFNYHDSLAALNPKIHLIANKIDSNGTGIINSSSIVQAKSVEVFLPNSPVLADTKYLSYSGNLNQTALTSIISIVMN